MIKVREQRFDECVDCIFFRPKAVSPRCLRCGAGEFFEERGPRDSLDNFHTNGRHRDE